MGGLNMETYFSRFWRLGVQDQGASRLVFSETRVLGLQMAAFSSRSHLAFPLSTCISGVSPCVQISSSYEDISHMGLGPAYLNELTLITSARILSSHKVTF